MDATKTIFIFGGSGSLGNKLIEKYSANQVINFSRDECKHWAMELKYKNIQNIIGNIYDYKSVETALIRTNPHIIIIAAALKHIDRCEYATDQCIKTNLLGIQNVLDCIDRNPLSRLETVVFISTDKACNPINVYGMCKALSEKMMIEKAFYSKTKVKYVTVRYGNVLNSRGSIIPILHERGTQPDNDFTLTHIDMTRFIMTLEDSCNLIEYAILNGTSGEIIIPKLRSMKVADLFEIFSEIYDKDVKVVGLRSGDRKTHV